MTEKKKIVVLSIAIILFIAVIMLLIYCGDKNVDANSYPELTGMTLELQQEKTESDSETYRESVQESASEVIELPFIPAN